MTKTSTEKKKSAAREYEGYLEFLKLPIDDKAILLEAAQGKHINGNAFALLYSLAGNEKYSD